jgi:hypothetical protein
MTFHLHFNQAFASALLLVGSVAMSAESPAPPQPPSSAVSQGACRAPSDARLLASDRRCPFFGHVWTSDDLKRTGARNVADALRVLDPSITIPRR